MYAEERQQAVTTADLSGGAGWVTDLAAYLRASPPRPCGATSPRWSARASSAGCTAAPSRRVRCRHRAR